MANNMQHFKLSSQKNCILKVKSAAFTLALITYVAIPLISSAQTGPGDTSGANGSIGAAGSALLDRACKVINYFYTGIIIVSVGCFLYAAWLFLSKASKDSAGVKGASQAALWAIVGLAIAIVAMGVPALVGNFLGVSVSANPCAATGVDSNSGE